MQRKKIAAGMILIAAFQFIMILNICEAIYPDYDIKNNYISDLGVWGTNTDVLFNSSIIIFGLLTALGAYLLMKDGLDRWLCILLMVAGLGTIGVGIFPENIINIHMAMAVIAFAGAGFAAILAYRIIPRPINYVTAAFGLFTLAVATLFGLRIFLGLGQGGMERIVALSAITWCMVFGGYIIGTTNPPVHKSK